MLFLVAPPVFTLAPFFLRAVGVAAAAGVVADGVEVGVEEVVERACEQAAGAVRAGLLAGEQAYLVLLAVHGKQRHGLARLAGVVEGTLSRLKVPQPADVIFE